jgi:hypothetical protein
MTDDKTEELGSSTDEDVDAVLKEEPENKEDIKRRHKKNERAKELAKAMVRSAEKKLLGSKKTKGGWCLRCAGCCCCCSFRFAFVTCSLAFMFSVLAVIIFFLWAILRGDSITDSWQLVAKNLTRNRV